MIFKGSEAELISFRDYLNSVQANIKFSLEFSWPSMNFLDTLVPVNNGILSTSLYIKPTDKNSILHAKTFHTKSLKQSKPYSQFLRLHRICSNTEDFN